MSIRTALVACLLIAQWGNFLVAQDVPGEVPVSEDAIQVEEQGSADFASPGAGSMLKQLVQRHELMLDWLAVSCSLTPAQTAACQQTIQMVPETGLGRVIAEAFDSDPPPLFGVGLSATSASHKLLDEWRRHVFTDSQLPILERSLANRESAHRLAFRDMTIVVLDEQILLTKAEREQLAQLWNHDSFAFENFPLRYGQRPYDFLYSQRPKVPAEFLRTLNPLQQEFASAWHSEKSETLTILDDRGRRPATAEANRDELAQRGEAAILKTFELQISFLLAAGEVTREQAESLRAAGRLIAGGFVDYWKREVFRPLEERPRLPRTATISVDALGPVLDNNWAPRGTRLQHYPTWTEALDKVLPEQRSAETLARAEFHAQSRANAVLALLDEELWLQPAQVEALRPLVRFSLPDTLDEPKSGDQDDILTTWCAYPLILIDIDRELDFLSTAQRNYWRIMQNSPRRNHQELQRLTQQQKLVMENRRKEAATNQP